MLALAFLAAIAGAFAFGPLTDVMRLGLLSVAGTFGVVAFGLVWKHRRDQRAVPYLRHAFLQMNKSDPLPCFASNAFGDILSSNPAARQRFPRAGKSMTSVLNGTFAHPETVVAAMCRRAIANGFSREVSTTRRGRMRITASRAAESGLIWRIDDSDAEKSATPSEIPKIILTRSDVVAGMNDALRKLIGEEPKRLDEIVTDLPLRNGEEHEIISHDRLLRCFVAVYSAGSDRREAYFIPVASDKAKSHDATAFDALPVPLMRLTPGGAVLEVNAAARSLIGDIGPGAKLSDLMEGLGRPINDWVADACLGRTDRRPEVLRLRGRDDEVFVQVTLSRMVEQGRVGLIAILTDATQFKQLEAQFTQSQKMQAIGQLAGGVAHDFNNLLTAISGHCDLLMLRRDKDAPDYGDLDQIRQNANRAAALVRQLLAFSRKQTMNPERLDLRDTLSDLTHLLNRLVGEKISLTVIHDPDLHPIRADKRQIEQVLMNLVVNARDAMPAGGEIRVETRNLDLATDLRRDRATVPAGDYVEVTVSDRGTGIPPEILPKIFEPFFTTKRLGEGTGLGLSTAYGIVKQTGGYIFCDSVEGTGTRFSILLPTYVAIGDESTLAHQEPTHPSASVETGASILLVEDEAAVRAFASRALKLRGHTVFEAENGEEALSILSDPALRFDIFVTDVIMPGMDGPTWVAEALEDRPETAVIFTSGYAEDAFRDGWPPIHNSAFLPKPFSLGDLAAMVQRTLGR